MVCLMHHVTEREKSHTTQEGRPMLVCVQRSWLGAWSARAAQDTCRTCSIEGTSACPSLPTMRRQNSSSPLAQRDLCVGTTGHGRESRLPFITTVKQFVPRFYSSLLSLPCPVVPTHRSRCARGLLGFCLCTTLAQHDPVPASLS